MVAVWLKSSFMLYNVIHNLSPFDERFEETKSYCLLTMFRHFGVKKMGPGVTDLSFLGCRTKTSKESLRPLIFTYHHLLPRIITSDHLHLCELCLLQALCQAANSLGSVGG
jgi:hypothetical protein